MRLPFLFCLVLAGVAAGSAPVAAQSVAPGVAERLALPPEAGPLLAAADATSPVMVNEVEAVQATGRGTALAIVGGALFVGGLIAGGDAGTLMVIAGAGIGAYGLYIMLSP